MVLSEMRRGLCLSEIVLVKDAISLVRRLDKCGKTFHPAVGTQNVSSAIRVCDVIEFTVSVHRLAAVLPFERFIESVGKTDGYADEEKLPTVSH